MKKILLIILVMLVLVGILIGYRMNLYHSSQKMSIEKLVLPTYLAYYDIGEKIENVEYAVNTNSIKIYFTEEIENDTNLDIYFLNCGDYSHIKHIDNENKPYKDNYSY